MPRQSGFLVSYASLKSDPAEEGIYRYDNPKVRPERILRQYSEVMPESTVVYFHPEAFGRGVDPNELKDKYTVILLLFFFLGPLILILAFYENKFIISQYLPLYNSEIIGYFGILLMLVGGIILLSSRYQLNRYSYGGGSLSAEIEQKLITNGMYRYIRHPIYAGGIIMTIGLELAFRSLIILSLHTIIYFVIFI